jgi:hypothetical protein
MARSPSSRRSAALAAALAAALLSMALPAAAADGQKRFAPKGIGRLTCAETVKMLDEKRQPEIENLVSWIGGYVTAFNTLADNTYDIAPWQNEAVMIELINRVCRANNTDHLTTVMERLTVAFAPSRLTQRQDLIDVKAGDKSVRIYPDVLRQAQQVLIKGGFLNGAADGSYGAKTKGALEAFQTKYKLPKTGVPDDATLFAMFILAQQGS